MKSSRFIRATERSNPEHKVFVSKNLDLIEQIYDIMDQKKWTQKDLARTLNKSESEISKWLSGFHNFTFNTIVKLEQALSATLITTPLKAKEHLSQTVRKNIELQYHLISSYTYFIEQKSIVNSHIHIKDWYHTIVMEQQFPIASPEKNTNNSEAMIISIAA